MESSEFKQPSPSLYPAILHGHKQDDKHSFNTYLSQKPHIMTMLVIIGALFIFSLITIFFLSNSMRRIPRTQNSTQVYPNSTSTTTPNNVATTQNWKTYRNIYLNFAFQYPPHWKLRDNKINNVPSSTYPYQIITLLSLDANYSDYGADLYIIIWNNMENLSIEDFVNIKNLAGNTEKNIAYKNIRIDGIDAKQVIGYPSQMGGIQIFLKKDNYIYQIQSNIPSDKKIYQEIFDQILSTFRFLD